MKKIIYILVLALITFNCEDQLERTPKDELSVAQAYETVSDLQRDLNDLYFRINYSGLIGHNSIFTDNSKLGVDNGGQQLNLLNQILNSETGGAGLWNNRYRVINGLNRIIEAAPTIDAAGQEADLDYILAQSYALRALSHSDLLIYFGLDMENPSADGVPYVDFVSTSATPARNSTQEVLDAIEADLVLAEDLLTSSNTDVTRINQDMINFLRAKLALYSGDYDGVISLADDLINRYPLANATQYRGMFDPVVEDVTEVVFKFDNVFGANEIIAGTWIFTGTGGSFIEMSNGLFNELSGSDVRRDVLLDPSSDPSNNLHVIGKYPAGADTNYINDYKAMRISEMYLIRAEAHARKTTPDFAASASDVAAVRSIRSGAATPAFNNLVDAITEIKAERRLELAFEGKRYIDIKRYRNILNEGIMRNTLDCGGATPCSLATNSEKWIFPIPQSEINANPAITQTPGY